MVSIVGHILFHWILLCWILVNLFSPYFQNRGRLNFRQPITVSTYLVSSSTFAILSQTFTDKWNVCCTHSHRDTRRDTRTETWLHCLTILLGINIRNDIWLSCNRLSRRAMIVSIRFCFARCSVLRDGNFSSSMFSKTKPRTQFWYPWFSSYFGLRLPLCCEFRFLMYIEVRKYLVQACV